MDRGHLLTEQANPLSAELDALATPELVDLFCRNDLEPQQAVAAAAPQLTAAVDAIAARLANGGRLFYLGAGTSGRLGVLDAAECPPTFCSDPSLVQGVLAGGAAVENKSAVLLRRISVALLIHAVPPSQPLTLGGMKRF
jgi:N-acetylmuramic acid 6-phosphate etherase